MNHTFIGKISAAGAIGALALIVSSATPTSANAQTRFSSLTAQEIQAGGYEDNAIALIAAVRDSSFGPTSVATDGTTARTFAQPSKAAENQSLDVDARAERTDSTQDRVAEISQTVPMTADGKAAVAKQVEIDREIERVATEGHAEVDIVAATISPISVVATSDRQTGAVLAEVTSYVAEQYRSGVVHEGVETTNVIFDAATGAVTSIHTVTDQEIAASTTEYIDSYGPASDSGVTADTTWYPEGKVPPEFGALVHLGGGYAPTIIKTGMTSTNKSKVVAYANKYWDTYNSSYRSFTNDCTNFVSQAMREGGWANDTGLWNDDHNWWYNSLNQTHSWGGAENWYKFARVNSGRVTAASNVYSLRPGDVLQVKYSGDTAIHHSMIVTLYSSSMIYLTYHSNDKHNVSFTWYNAQQSVGVLYYGQFV